MKNITVRKIVLYSVALLSAIMLIVGLSFSVASVSYGGEKRGINGFDSLSFAFPATFNEFYSGLSNGSDFFEFYEIIFGVSSLLTLVFAVLFIGLIVLAFFKFDKKKGEKTLKILLAVAIVVTIIHAVFPIIFNINLNICKREHIEYLLENSYDYDYSYSIEMLEELKLKNSAFVSLILQVVILVGYIVCSKMIKESEVVSEKQTTGKCVVEKLKMANDKTQIEEVSLSFENSAIELFKEYKKLHSENIITDAEYMDKRVKMMTSTNEKLNIISKLIKNASFEEMIYVEKMAVQLLREYKNLLDNQFISDSDFIAKKVALLGCVIK